MQKVIDSIVLWKLAILRLVFYCFVVAAAQYLSAMHGSKWTQLDGEDRFELILGIMAAVAMTIIAFLDKAVAKLASGSDTPPDVGDTQIFQQTQTQKTTTIVEPPKTESIQQIQ